MNRFVSPATLRVVVYPLLGAAGAIVAMVWPLGHKTFCTGIGTVLV